MFFENLNKMNMRKPHADSCFSKNKMKKKIDEKRQKTTNFFVFMRVFICMIPIFRILKMQYRRMRRFFDEKGGMYKVKKRKC